ncbi:MAG: hypothetical protein GXO79_11085 [Chlorobi bacterium]|nr:hypothetical protein [Chlorobiota bacterium]
MKKFFLIALATFVVQPFFSQIQIGQWREHLPYSNAKCITASADKVYCSTELSLFSYQKTDGEIEKINTITGLSDIEISALKYNKSTETLVIGYANGNIDLIKDRQIQNVSDIKRKVITGSKSINNIMFVDSTAYLSTGFGIVLLDTKSGNISDTYIIGENATYVNVNELVLQENTNLLFAATDKGIFSADFNNPNLIDYQNWFHYISIPNFNSKFESITNFNNKIYVSYAGSTNNTDTLYVYDGINWSHFDNTINNIERLIGTTYNLLIVRTPSIEYRDTAGNFVRKILDYGFNRANPRDVLLEGNNLWIADNTSGLVIGTNYKTFESAYPNGPVDYSAFSMASVNDNLWAVPGGKLVTAGNTYYPAKAYSYINNSWNSYDRSNEVNLTGLIDFVLVKINPQNPDNVFFSSWGNGLVEFKNGEYVKTYNDTNTNGALQNIPGLQAHKYIRIGGMAFDSDNNLWMTNASVPNAIVVKKQNGEWLNLKYSPISNNTKLGKIIVAQNGDKWVMIPGTGLFVFNENGTIDDESDDEYKLFSVKDEDGNIISNDIYAIEQDLDGIIWVGTNEGVVAYYNPQNVFTGNYFYAQRIIVELEAENAQYLLGKETVTAIAVDGANRKWFGTNNGVFLMSENVDKEIYAFATDNSPLISNKIVSIAINANSGEVFFGTDKGIISFRSDANNENEYINNVYVFPNPVRYNYDGPITITGLIRNTNVKITDVAGNLVWETVSNGGEAVWNGKNFSGQKPQTGIYLVFCTNSDGSQTATSKILIVN